MKRIRGIDSIRFVCAMFVVFGHGFLPTPEILEDPQGGNLYKIAGGLLGTMFNGPSAVIAFFIISGFCIHYPNKEADHIHLPSFYIKRLIRICLPALIALIAWISLHKDLNPPEFGVFWSIICEIIYYLLYPIVLKVAKLIKWEKLIAVSYLCAFVLIFSNLDTLQASHNSYVALGLLTWIIGMPCWLLGCWLAENFNRFPIVSFNKIWMIRIGIFLASWLLRIAKFHVPSVLASNCITLNLFAIPVCIWLGLEIMYFHKKEPSKVLEWGGVWSYSLYMIHPIVTSVLDVFTNGNRWGSSLTPMIEDVATLIFALVLSYCFYFIVERPSHKIAVFMGKKMKERNIGQPQAA